MIGQIPQALQSDQYKSVTAGYDPKRAPTQIPLSSWSPEITKWIATENARKTAARSKGGGSLYDATQYGAVIAPPGFRGSGLRKLDNQLIDAILKGWSPEQVEMLKNQGLKTHQWLQESLFPAGKGGFLGSLLSTGLGLAFPAAGVAMGVAKGLSGNPLSAATSILPLPSGKDLLSKLT